MKRVVFIAQDCLQYEIRAEVKEVDGTTVIKEKDFRKEEDALVQAMILHESHKAFIKMRNLSITMDIISSKEDGQNEYYACRCMLGNGGIIIKETKDDGFYGDLFEPTKDGMPF